MLGVDGDIYFSNKMFNIYLSVFMATENILNQVKRSGYK